MVTTHIRIHGLVQGVGFRASLATEARRRRLAGWVRNRRDGTVEALVAGAASEVEALVAWARRGPSAASVTRVEVDTDRDALEAFDARDAAGGFEQRPTA